MSYAIIWQRTIRDGDDMEILLFVYEDGAAAIVPEGDVMAINFKPENMPVLADWAAVAAAKS